MADSVSTRPSISSDGARSVTDAAVAEAERLGLAAVVVIVDESGVLKALHRMDGALLGSVQVAQDKAYSSAATKTPTSAWLNISKADEAFGFGLSGIDRVCPLPGGLPITVDDQVVGAVGISGGTVEQDEQIALAALAPVADSTA